jgi:hypothetical protein
LQTNYIDADLEVRAEIWEIRLISSVDVNKVQRFKFQRLSHGLADADSAPKISQYTRKSVLRYCYTSLGSQDSFIFLAGLVHKLRVQLVHILRVRTGTSLLWSYKMRHTKKERENE